MKFLYLLCVVTFVKHAGCINPFTHRYWLNKDFKTLVQVTNRATNESATIQEYYTNGGDRNWDRLAAGAMKIHSKDGDFHYVYRSSYQDAYYVNLQNEATMCVSQKINHPIPGVDKAIQWNWRKNVTQTSSIVGPTAFIASFTAPNYYCPRTFYAIRGIWTHKCTSHEYKNLNVILYMARRSWNVLSLTKVYDVVRLSVQGTVPAGTFSNSNMQATQINVDYDFIQISPRITERDREFLQIPVGRGCVGTNEFSPISFTDGFSVNGEIVVKKGTHNASSLPGMTAFTLVYDMENNAYAINQDYFTKEKNATVVAKGRNYTVVLENNHYQFDRSTLDSECTTSMKNDYALTLNLPDGETLNYAGANVMFNFTGFKFMGVVKTRGLFTRAYEKSFTVLKDGMTVGGSIIQSGAIVTLYELDPSFGQSSSETKTFYYVRTPVALEIRLLDRPFSKLAEVAKLITINYREFENLGVNSQRMNMMSISRCLWQHGHQLSFQVTYKGYYGTGFLKHQTESLEQKFRATVHKASNITPLRVINPQVTFQSSSFKIMATLLERPTPLLDFDLKSKNVAFTTDTNTSKINFVLSEEDCAKKCLLVKQSLLCNSYVWCNFTCYLYQLKTKPSFQKLNQTSPICNYRTRNDNSMNDRDMDFNQEVLSSIQDGLWDFNFPDALSMNISMMVYKKKVVYWATDLTTDLVQNSIRGGGQQNYDHRFRVIKSGYHLAGNYVDRDYSPVESYVILTYSQCARECQLETDFYCETFSYCVAHGTCLLSHLNMDVNGVANLTELVKQSDCYIIGREYLDDYTVSKNIVIVTGDGKKVKAKNANACAKICNDRNLQNDHCESFDICNDSDPENAYCVLHKTHFLDLTSASQLKSSNLCSHYSKRFMKDYRRRGNFALPKSFVSVAYSQLSVENCSKRCSEAEGCTGFDFCQGESNPSTECHLTKNSTIKKGLLHKSLLCKFYNKIYDSTGHYVGPSIVAAQTGSKPVSKGTVGAIAFVMVVVGAIIAAVALVAFFRYRARAGL